MRLIRYMVPWLIKGAAWLNCVLGLLIRKSRPYSLSKDIQTVLIKRTDRVGDAVVSLAFLLELGKRFQVSVLPSRQNAGVLEKFFRTVSLEEVQSGAAYDVCIDLNGLRDVRSLRRIRNCHKARFIVGFNAGVFNGWLDYSDRKYPVLFNRQNIVTSYRDLVRDALGIEVDVPDSIELGHRAELPGDFRLDDFILVNVAGRERYRGPSPGFFARLIDTLDFNGRFVVMDETGRPHMAELKKLIRRGGVTYLERDYSLWELAAIAAKARLYIGSDSGISHLLSMPGNALVLYGTGCPQVWKPYCRSAYTAVKKEGIVVEEALNSAGKRKKVVYAPVRCRPCFDMGCPSVRCISALENNSSRIASELLAMLQ